MHIIFISSIYQQFQYLLMIKQANSSVLYITNFLEVSLDLVRNLGTRQQITEELNSFYVYNEHYLFGTLCEFRNSRKQFYIYCPFAVDEVYLEYVSELVSIPRESIHVLVANLNMNNHVGNICEALLEDEENLINLHDIDIVCECNSPEMFRLRDALKDRAHFIEGVSEECWDRVKNFGTKSGIRQLIESMADENIRMPEGRIFYKSNNSYNEAVAYLVQKLQREGAVAKIDQGYAGKGVVIIHRREVEAMDEPSIKHFVERKMIEPYWRKFHIIVEDLVCFKDEKSKEIPYCLMRINDNRELETLAILGMIQDEDLFSIGFEIGKGVMKQELADKITYASRKIGEVYLKAGYRGYFDVDFIIDDRDNVFITQSNVRRDDGTPIHNFAVSMYGKQYEKTHYIMSIHLEVEKLKSTDFQTICELAKQNCLNFTKEKGGIAFTGINPYRINELQLVVAGTSKAEAMQKVEKLKELCKIFE